jgi:acetyl-CoA carboxylase biotin carboxyl carrier protein
LGSRKRAVGRRRRSAKGGGAAAGKGGGARGKAGGGSKARKSSRFPEVEELVELMDRHGLLEVDVHTAPDGTRRLRLARAGAASHANAAAHAPHPAGSHGSAARPAAAPEPAAPAAPVEKLHAFTSPMVGTFYRAPSPEAPPFVSVGDRVDEHRTVCIIEAMKVMNEITPDIAGEIVSIEVENGEAVEYGQTLFLIRPA